MTEKEYLRIQRKQIRLPQQIEDLDRKRARLAAEAIILGMPELSSLDRLNAQWEREVENAKEAATKRLGFKRDAA